MRRRTMPQALKRDYSAIKGDRSKMCLHAQCTLGGIINLPFIAVLTTMVVAATAGAWTDQPSSAPRAAERQSGHRVLVQQGAQDEVGLPRHEPVPLRHRWSLHGRRVLVPGG